MLVNNKSVVTIRYLIKDVLGNILDDTYYNTPVRFKIGSGAFPYGFEEQLKGLKKGMSAQFKLLPEKGYGQRRKDLILKVEKKELPGVENFKVGDLYRKFNENLESDLFVVKGFIGNWVYLDQNHPFAGKELLYEVQIDNVELKNE